MRLAAVLDQALDRDPGVAHRGGNLGQHAGTVGDDEAQVRLAHPVARGGGSHRLEFGDRDRERRAHFAADHGLAGDVDQVGDHRAGGRPIARARALEQQAAREIALRHHRVGRPVDVRERVLARDEVGMDALEQGIAVSLGDPDQADAITQLIGLRDIGGEHPADPRGLDRPKIDPAAERDAGQNRELVRGVDPVDVKRRIGLGKAFRLRLRQDIGKVAPGVLHGREDVVAGAVEDAINPLDRIGRGAFAQALDHRDTARHRRLELQRHARCLGRLRQFQPVVRDHRLVGGDQRLAPAQRGACAGQRRSVGAADQFDHHVDIVARGQRGHVVVPGEAGDIDTAIFQAFACRDRGDLDRAPGAARD